MEKEKDQKPTRKHGRHLRVPVLPEEETEIKSTAEAAGLSVAAYLRNVGLGYKVQGTLDNRMVDELARINGDLGRLGGLLKLWLTDEQRTAVVGSESIRFVLHKIEKNQEEMLGIMRLVVMPRSSARE